MCSEYAEAWGEAPSLSPAGDLARVLDGFSLPIFVKDRAHRFTYCNDAFCALMGRTQSELIGRSDPDFFPASQANKFWAADDQVLQSGEDFRTEEEISAPDGSVRTISTHKRMVRLRFGAQEDSYILATISEVTLLRSTEKSLRFSEDHYRHSMELSPNIPWVANADGLIVEVSSRWLSVTGTPAEEALKNGWSSALHPQDREATMLSWSEALRSAADLDIDYRLRGADGEYRWFRARASARLDAHGRVERWYGTLEDIDDRKKAEQAIRFQATLLDCVDNAIIGTDLNGLVTYWGRAAADLYGWSAEEAMGIHVLALTSPIDHTSELADEIFGFLRAGHSYREVVDGRRKDGTVFPCQLSVTPVRDSHGELLGNVSISSDISARKEAELRLQRSEELYRQLADNASDMISRCDLQGIRTYVSPACRYILGYEPKELLGVSILAHVHPDDASCVLAEASDLISGKKEQVGVTYRMARKDGSWVTVEVLRKLIKDASGQPVEFLTIARDVTQRLKLQDQLQQAQKMETIGQLTGGIAHDFNNLLTVILGNAEILTETVDDPELRSLSEMMLNAAERGSELTRQLLAFARRQPLQPKAVEVHELLVGMSKLLRRTLSEDIGIAFHLDAGSEAWESYIDAAQLESAVLNLCLNARDAMPGGGKLTVESRNVELRSDDTEIDVNVSAGEYVLISVTDTGTGMPPDVVKRVFEPFFTTKDVGKGSGLGLSMVYGFITQSNGYINVYSEVGQGTTIKLYLPRAAPIRSSSTEALGPDMVQGGTSKILVVEDEPEVLAFVVWQLKSLGYSVQSARNGPEALSLLAANQDFDLLLTDVVMPGGMNGPELAKKSSMIAPGIPVLFTSGYTENALIHQGRLDADVHLLSKPYRRAELAAKVKAALEGGVSLRPKELYG